MRSSRWLIAVLLLAACTAKQQAPPDPEVLADAADSARIAVWEPEAAVADTTKHSAFYDSVYKYIRESVEIERARRLYGAAVAGLTPLTSAHLKSNRYRQLAIDSLSRYVHHDSDWSAALGNLMSRYRAFTLRTLDTLYKDSLRYERALPDILRPDLFYPHWRPAYDSIEAGIVARSLDVLRLVDTNARQIRFEEDLRFSDYDAAGAYDSLRKVLDSLVLEEQRVSRSVR